MHVHLCVHSSAHDYSLVQHCSRGPHMLVCAALKGAFNMKCCPYAESAAFEGLPFKEPFLLTNSIDNFWLAQVFGPDLALIDFVLAGGGALADKLGIPKAINCITGLLPPVVEHAYRSGASLLSSVPQWMSLAPRKMVSSRCTALAHRQLQ